MRIISAVEYTEFKMEEQDLRAKLESRPQGVRLKDYLTDPEIEFIEQVIAEDVCLAAKAWLVQKGHKGVPVCNVCGIKVEWSSSKGLFPLFCSRSCLRSPAGQRVVQDARDRNNIEKWGVANPMQKSEFKANQKQVVLEKYGVDNPSKSEEIKRKKIETCRSTHGVDHPMQSEDVRSKSQVTLLKTRGVRNISQDPSIKEDKLATLRDGRWEVFTEQLALKHLKPLFSREEYMAGGALKYLCDKCGKTFEFSIGRLQNIYCPDHYFQSDCEFQVFEFLQGLGVTVQPNRRINVTGELVEDFAQTHYEVDLLLPDLKIGIEIDGIYWHSDVFKHKNYHLEKTEFFAKHGIRLIHIFDCEWLYHRHKVEAFLKNITQRAPIKLRAEDCALERVKRSPLFELHHMQGDCGAPYTYALTNNGQHVAAASFGKPRFNSEYDWELLRLVTHPDFMIYGGFARLLKIFKQDVMTQGQKLITYCDRRFFTGQVYLNNGFKLTHTSAPGYYYVHYGQNNRDISDLMHRVNFQKHKLEKILRVFNPELTEYENMRANYYYRVWDCGNYVFSLVKE